MPVISIIYIFMIKREKGAGPGRRAAAPEAGALGVEGRALPTWGRRPRAAPWSPVPADTRGGAAAGWTPCPGGGRGVGERHVESWIPGRLGSLATCHRYSGERAGGTLGGRDLAVTGRMGEWWEGHRRSEREHFINI